MFKKTEEELKHQQAGLSLPLVAVSSSSLDAEGHVHNLFGKALDPMFNSFLTSVLEQLPPAKKVLVDHCQSFEEFSKAVDDLKTGTPNQKVVIDATTKFCNDYDALPSFWKQATKLREFNRVRNVGQHCSVAISAARVREALDEELDELVPTGRILGALVSYSMRNSAEIDTEADKKRKEELRMLREWTSRRGARTGDKR